MDSLRLAENIARLRRERKITQEQLADFIGVTKASVSKWETKQSIPDVLLLPQLAAFFDVTIDELLGYEPQLSKEQIQKLYLTLSEAFATEEFDVVMERSRKLVRKYYSCYEFLLQIAVLWLNHQMLAGGEKGVEILKECKVLCDHVHENCKEIRLCSDAIALKASICLQLGESAEVIELLEKVCDPCRLEIQNDSTLINAYLQAGELKKANEFTQISMYLHLIFLLGGAMQELYIHGQDLVRCEETMKRALQVAEAYQMEKFLGNHVVLLHYQMAIVYQMHGKKKEALECLDDYVHITQQLLKSEDLSMQPDDYFDTLQVWFDRLPLGGSAPRNKKIVYDSMIAGLKAPVFAELFEEPEYQRLLENAKKGGENLWNK